ncbi:MAG: plastocyanin/azurin family copper-binding protein [Candidatus Poseidoniaceae archaeon]|nr:plastocyanin/azurin family copper-binding protein [Candidatus Poseidoniaceae archaeon]
MRRLLCLAIILCLLQGNLGLETEQETETHVVTVDSTNLRFTPSTLTINEGDTLRFVWGGQALPHNSVEENGVFDSGDPERAVDYGHVFDYDSAGTYNFFCEPHESVGMLGSVTVLDVEAPMDDQQNNSANMSSGQSMEAAMNWEPVYAVGLIILFSAATWRARIYD